MFGYDEALLAKLSEPVASVSDVLDVMRTIQSTCVDGDGLKWFNWLYLSVTEAVDQKIRKAEFQDSAWLAELDVQFARLYFGALQVWLNGEPPAGCWRALFSQRSQTQLARIQFALAGINAHINHDLAIALVNTHEATQTSPDRLSPHYLDYTNLNATLESLIDDAKKSLNVRLLGEVVPVCAQFENTVAAFSTAAAREAAWRNSEILWHLKPSAALSDTFLDSLDGLTTVASKALLVPVF